MKFLVIESWFTLLLVDLSLHLRGFKTLHQMLQKQKEKGHDKGQAVSSAALSQAMDLACVFYLRRVSALARSAAVTLILCRYGWRADLVLGVQVFPYEPYAWAEVEGRIVNDQPNLLDIYQVLERC